MLKNSFNVMGFKRRGLELRCLLILAVCALCVSQLLSLSGYPLR